MRSLILSLLISLSPAAARVQQSPGGGQFAIAVDVDLVTFSVAVTDSRGRLVSGLKAADFRVYEEGKLQGIKLFTAEDAPASVGLIIDNSGSMDNKRAEVVAAALAFASTSNPADEMFLVNFNENVYLGLPPGPIFTSDTAALREALLRSAPVGMTALYDALIFGIDLLKTGVRDRKALVVFSDGGDNASHHTLNEVLRAARGLNATIYAVGIYDEADADKNRRVLREIAERNGGRAYFPESLRNISQIAREIAAGIRGQYTLGYSSSNTRRDGTFRKVKITARRSGGRELQVDTREGYVAPAAALPPQ